MTDEILMKLTRFSEPQFLAILRHGEGGVPVTELCREHGISTASFYKWRVKYGGMDASMILRPPPVANGWITHRLHPVMEAKRYKARADCAFMKCMTAFPRLTP